ncbi:aspartyl/glutamyl-tRNA(Asn/Gln) amidotransferase subunit C [Clostridium sp. CAG:1219]|nr:aspartyl/glutamyl-tRNA(Asn/Gln) amidotransferase subunit C [Clostridium sp. CAG:1219]
MGVSRDDIIHIAKLSRLEFTDEELEKYTKDLDNIVNFANTLSEIDVTGVKPTNHILDIKNVFRKDEVKPSYDRDLILKNAPTKAGGCVSVPKVVE